MGTNGKMSVIPNQAVISMGEGPCLPRAGEIWSYLKNEDGSWSPCARLARSPVMLKFEWHQRPGKSDALSANLPEAIYVIDRCCPAARHPGRMLCRTVIGFGDGEPKVIGHFGRFPIIPVWVVEQELADEAIALPKLPEPSTTAVAVVPSKPTPVPVVAPVVKPEPAPTPVPTPAPVMATPVSAPRRQLRRPETSAPAVVGYLHTTDLLGGLSNPNIVKPGESPIDDGDLAGKRRRATKRRVNAEKEKQQQRLAAAAK